MERFMIEEMRYFQRAANKARFGKNCWMATALVFAYYSYTITMRNVELRRKLKDEKAKDE